MTAAAPLSNSCPHCSGKAGYYRKVTMSGVGRRNYCFDGSVDDNTSFLDAFTEHEKKTMYCQECNQSVGTCKE